MTNDWNDPEEELCYFCGNDADAVWTNSSYDASALYVCSECDNVYADAMKQSVMADGMKIRLDVVEYERRRDEAQRTERLREMDDAVNRAAVCLSLNPKVGVQLREGWAAIRERVL